MSQELNQKSTSINSGYQLHLNYKKLFKDILRFWWLFALFLAVSLGIVYFILRYSIPVYQASSTILIEEKSSASSQENMMEGFGLTPGMRNVDNQIAVLTSWDVVYEAAKRLDFAISYHAEGNLKTSELYNSAPFTVIIDSLYPQLVETPIFVIPVDANHFKLVIKESEGARSYVYQKKQLGSVTGSTKYEKIHKLGEIIETPFLKIIISSKTPLDDRSDNKYFVFHSYESITQQLRSHFTAVKTNQTSSIVRLTTVGTNSEKNIKFLNTVADIFIEFNLAKKNQIALNTIQFIEDQLGAISDSLHVTGSELSRFRSENKLLSIESKGEQLYVKLEDENKRVADLIIMRNYYNYLKDYFTKGELESDVIAPAIFKIDNPLLTQSINSIIEINTKILIAKDQAGGGKNPFEQGLLTQIEVIRKTMIQAIENQKIVINKSIDSSYVQIKFIEGNLLSLPETERKLLGIQRKFELNSEVFTFLLRKRSESQIQKASNTPDHQVLERARFSAQIAPTSSEGYKKGIIFGLLIPFIIVVVNQLLNNKISSTEDIERITNVPIIGHVIHSEKQESMVVFHYPKSVVTETFRRIRTRMEFMIGNKKAPIIAVSSSIPNEGKTFCALNIASAFALAGKKTVLCGFDLRKPGLNVVLGLSDRTGISNFLVSQATFEETFVDIGQKNLTIIPSGHIPPNPAELISTPKCTEFFDLLKANFEIIIIDTPPMGIVSDSYILARYVDSLIFITRQNYSIREALTLTMQNIQAEGVKNIGIILNDVDIRKESRRYGSYAYNYGYGYTYGYTYGYYED